MYRIPTHGDDLSKVAWEKADYTLLYLDDAVYDRIDSSVRNS